jgi:hypothetical protein
VLRAMTLSMPIFDPHARIDTLTLDDGQRVHVVDDALAEPERLRAWVLDHADAFEPVGFSQYPGRYIMAPAIVQEDMRRYFLKQMRPLFDARRLLRLHARFSIATQLPEQLRPPQWLCHRDHFGLDARQSIQASVLYLFEDDALGGTGFYAPARPAREMSALFNDAIRMSGDAFGQRYGLSPGYITESNRYFQRTGGVSARWNRMVFYDGQALHSSDIAEPGRLNDDPQHGRLTLNGFFTSTRHAR